MLNQMIYLDIYVKERRAQTPRHGYLTLARNKIGVPVSASIMTQHIIHGPKSILAQANNLTKT